MRDIPVVHIEEVRARLAGRFGPAVAGWCAELPALLDAVAGQWQLRLGQAWSAGGTSVVLPCWADGGEQLVLKLTPELQIAADEAAALQGWAASPHAVLLHHADLERGALLLERVQPGTRLADEPGPWPWVLASGGGEAAVQNRIDRLAGYVDEVDADRLWAWCKGLAVVVAVSLLSRRADDQVGRELLGIAAG